MKHIPQPIHKLAAVSGGILFLFAATVSAEIFSKQESLEFDAADLKTIEVNTSSGDVTIEKSDGAVVQVDVILTVKSSSEEKAEAAFEHTNINIEALEDLLNIEVKNSGSGFSFLGFGKLYPDIQIMILCPPDIDLKVATGSGDVAAVALQGNSKIATGSGDILFDSVSGNIQVATGSGDVLAKDFEGALDAATGSGDISVTGLIPRFKVATGSGDVHIVSHANISGDSKAATGSGDVQIELPENSSFHLNAESDSGDIRLLFLSSGDFNASDSLDVQVGEGGPSLNLGTGSGDITVKASH